MWSLRKHELSLKSGQSINNVCGKPNQCGCCPLNEQNFWLMPLKERKEHWQNRYKQKLRDVKLSCISVDENPMIIKHDSLLWKVWTPWHSPTVWSELICFNVSHRKPRCPTVSRSLVQRLRALTAALWKRVWVQNRCPKHLVRVVSRPHSKHSRTLISVARLSLWMWLDI